MSRGDWQRVSRRRPCPVCEKPDWCLFTGDESAPSAAICARVESDKRVGDQGAGWLHVLRHDRPAWPEWKRTVHVAARQVGPEPSAPPAVDFGDLAARALASTDDAQRERFAAAGLPVGMMFSAHLGQDARLLELAYELEAATPWPTIADRA